ncbi:YdcH family protein [Sulfuriflexus sp.]|uniref:YdcH family protein n=1 Tax=Sulfuriflexus sp. TaxID=2015443 RepID=UPI0028CC00B1|nr:YdcH family protein [Sulfuriflexus sp.]MDT8405273.1 YdcH family protein [Sulfuriflexus sp.]
MLGEHHHLATEFPEYKEQIHKLKADDAHFSKLHDEYNALDDEIYRIEEGIETTADDYLETLKKKRLALKDELLTIIKQA